MLRLTRGSGARLQPHAALDNQANISGPLFDRIDLHMDVAAVSAADLTLPPPVKGSAEIAELVAAARQIQADGTLLEATAAPDEAGRTLLAK